MWHKKKKSIVELVMLTPQDFDGDGACHCEGNPTEKPPDYENEEEEDSDLDPDRPRRTTRKKGEEGETYEEEQSGEGGPSGEGGEGGGGGGTGGGGGGTEGGGGGKKGSSKKGKGKGKGKITGPTTTRTTTTTTTRPTRTPKPIQRGSYEYEEVFKGGPTRPDLPKELKDEFERQPPQDKDTKDYLLDCQKDLHKCLGAFNKTYTVCAISAANHETRLFKHMCDYLWENCVHKHAYWLIKYEGKNCTYDML